MPGGHDTTIEVSNIMSFVLYTQILKQSVLKPASPGITPKRFTEYQPFFKSQILCNNKRRRFQNVYIVLLINCKYRLDVCIIGDDT